MSNTIRPIIFALPFLLTFETLRTVPAQCLPDVPLASIPNPSPGSLFEFMGGSTSISGNRVVAGVPGSDAGAPDAGAAHVFDSSSGALLATLSNPAPNDTDRFGISVSISGNLAVVGAAFDDSGSTDTGIAYSFDLSAGANPPVLATLANPTPVPDARFGNAVAISGTRAVVGADREDAAYVFDATTGALLSTLTDPATASSSDSFGVAVAISGDLVIVGAERDDFRASSGGAAYVYDLSAGANPPVLAALYSPGSAFLTMFGSAVAIAGTLAVVGVHRSDIGQTDAGVAYVFDVASGGVPAAIATLSNPTPMHGDRFGFSVAIQGNLVCVGETLVGFGSFGRGIVHIYDLADGANPPIRATIPNPTSTTDDFGASISLSGNRIAVGAPSAAGGFPWAGAVHTYHCTPFSAAISGSAYE